MVQVLRPGVVVAGPVVLGSGARTVSQTHERVGLAVQVTDLMVERERPVVMITGPADFPDVAGAVTQPADAVGLAIALTAPPVQLERLAVVVPRLAGLVALVGLALLGWTWRIRSGRPRTPA